ncbi:hypothetical protein [Mycobacterium sp. URHB0021]
MRGHVGINVPALRTAKAYHEVITPFVGFEAFPEADDEFAYRPCGGKPGTTSSSGRFL